MADFSMFQGDTKLLKVHISDDSGASVDVSGTFIRWQLAKSADDPPLIEKATSDAGISIIDGPGGRFDVMLDPLDTEDLAGTYYYEAEVDDGGVISTVLTGTVDIKPALIAPVTP